MWRSIRDANPGKVSTKGEIVEGARLIIPKRSAQADDPLTSFPTEAISGSTDGPTRQRVRIITVKDGQTLSAIAAEHLGSARKWQLIMDVNTDVLDKPENLRAGMKLRVPAEPVVELIETANDALAERERETTPQPPRETRAKTYTVKAGDSLYKIAEKQLGDGERFNEIYETNRDKLSSADAIRAGMKLTLPKR